jgi:hypothetical protein
VTRQHSTRRHRCSATAWGVVLAVAATILAPGFPGVRPLPAQTVLGTAVDRVDGSPVAGAFVLLLDAETGEERDRTLTTRSGTFRVGTRRAGTYRLSLERIGFETLRTDPFTLGEDERLSRRLEVSFRPIELSGIEVTGRREASQCGTPAGEALELSQVWAEARKALQATAWTDRQTYYRFDALLLRQGLDAQGDTVGSPEYEPIRIYGRHPFRAVHPNDLAYGGWVQRQGSTVKFFAPDAEVMLSDSFLRRHCFRLVSGDSVARGLVGVEFAPRPNAWVSEIAGVLWVDEASAELRRLDFRYVNIDLPIAGDVYGGNVTFDQLPDGGWIVQSWEIRTPGGLEGQRVLAVWRTGDLQASPGAELPTEVAPVQAPPDEVLKRYPVPEGLD